MAQPGDLEVLVIQASQLKDVETFGRMDPFVVLTLPGQTFKTKADTDAGKKPQWNERFRFVAVNPQYATELHIQVLDKNVMLSDTEIGSARVPLSNVYAVKCQDARVPLVTKKGKSAGEIELVLTWKPYAAPPAPTPAPVQPQAFAPQPAPQPFVQQAPAPQQPPSLYPQIYQGPNM